jgi:hypothetical protein
MDIYTIIALALIVLLLLHVQGIDIIPIKAAFDPAIMHPASLIPNI